MKITKQRIAMLALGAAIKLALPTPALARDAKPNPNGQAGWTAYRYVCLGYPSNIALVNGEYDLESIFGIDVQKSCQVLAPAPCNDGVCPELSCKVNDDSELVSSCG